MEERELMNSCPICGCLHDGGDELCEDCIKRVNREVRRIQDARDALVTDMIIDAAGADNALMRIVKDCIKCVNREVKRIQDARDALVTDMLIEAAGADETLMRIIEEGLNSEDI